MKYLPRLIEKRALKQFSYLKQVFFHTRFTSLTASSTNVLKMLPNPGTPANVIAFHPYNPKIVVAGNNHIKMWDIREGKFGAWHRLKFELWPD